MCTDELTIKTIWINAAVRGNANAVAALEKSATGVPAENNFLAPRSMG
jgi:hypothetical protein